MARIEMETLKKVDKERNTIHSKVSTTYTVFELDGKKYVQLDTYGRSSRDMPEKVSQSLQIDRDSAAFIANLLITEFNLSVKIS